MSRFVTITTSAARTTTERVALLLACLVPSAEPLHPPACDCSTAAPDDCATYASPCTGGHWGYQPDGSNCGSNGGELSYSDAEGRWAGDICCQFCPLASQPPPPSSESSPPPPTPPLSPLPSPSAGGLGGVRRTLYSKLRGTLSAIAGAAPVALAVRVSHGTAYSTMGRVLVHLAMLSTASGWKLPPEQSAEPELTITGEVDGARDRRRLASSCDGWCVCPPRPCFPPCM